MAETMLTTVDNPYNPFTQFEDWMAYDHQKGYYSMEYLARIANTSMDLPDNINFGIIEDAINEILSFDLLGIYQKVTRESFDSMKDKSLTDENKSSLELLQGSKAFDTLSQEPNEVQSEQQTTK